MFGKRKEDQKHRLGEAPEADAREPHDPDLVAALEELGRNRHAPLAKHSAAEPAVEPDLDSDAEQADAPGTEPDAESDADTDGAPDTSADHADEDSPDRPAWASVPTAAMLAEPEPAEQSEQPEQPDPLSVGVMASQALNRERATVAEQEAALHEAREEIASLKSQLEGLQAEAERSQSAESDASARTADVDSGLAAELETARAEAAAAGVALERVEREAKEQETALAAAEERADRLAAEVERLRNTSVSGPAQVERLRREAEREQALRGALDQARAATGQAEAAVAENRKLASDLTTNLQSQETLIAALTGLQAEITEQRVWFEAQLANVREMESQQVSVVEALQASIKERDAELETLRQQLLDLEAKRAEEAAAFVAALERQ